jgi:protein MpaA
MSAKMITMHSLSAPDPEFAGAFKRSCADLVSQFEAVSLTSDFLASGHVPPSIARYVFEGPHGGGDPIRIGFFAGIHGDEQAGSYAILELARTLVRNPYLAEGYHLYFYPICNPGGFDARSRYSPSGKDLNREFWKRSAEPEVQVLEREILEHAFHGLVSFHCDQVIDGFPAENGIISKCYDGILTSPPKLENTPFEIILETPHHAPEPKQIEAFVRASLAILAEYRKFIAFAADL